MGSQTCGWRWVWQICVRLRTRHSTDLPQPRCGSRGRSGNSNPRIQSRRADMSQAGLSLTVAGAVLEETVAVQYSIRAHNWSNTYKHHKNIYYYVIWNIIWKVSSWFQNILSLFPFHSTPACFQFSLSCARAKEILLHDKNYYKLHFPLNYKY